MEKFNSYAIAAVVAVYGYYYQIAKHHKSCSTISAVTTMRSKQPNFHSCHLQMTRDCCT